MKTVIISCEGYGLHPRDRRTECMAVSTSIIECNLSIMNVLVQPVASGGIHIICP
jgi:hypothetical protein